MGAILATTHLLWAQPALAQPPSYDPAPWLADLDQTRDALTTKYANLEWVALTQQVNLEDVYDAAAKRLRAAHSDAEAEHIFDLMLAKLGDGHVEIDWPKPQALKAAGDRLICDDQGYNAGPAAPSFLENAPDFHALPVGDTPEFPAGIITVGRRKIGVLRIGMFGPQMAPALCQAALTALHLSPVAPCDDACSDRIDLWTEERLSADLAGRIRALKTAGAQVLLIDVSGNGGGTQWVEQAARIIAGDGIVSERLGYVRGEHWATKWARWASDLRYAAKTADAKDAKRLNAWAAEIDAKQAEARKPCDGAPLWRGNPAACPWVADGFFATGLLGVDDASIRGKPWASEVFSPAEAPYEAGVWKGPLIVLIDQDSWSATEEFAAELQDNRAALIIGTPSGGAGCGHTDGGTPVTLSHSGGVLKLPDCVRLRRDGSNEVGGVQPDLLIGLRKVDGPAVKAKRVLAALPAVVKAVATRPTDRGVAR